MASPLHPWKTDEQDELIELGNNWFIHNPKQYAVRVRYEAIDPNHPALPAAEAALNKMVHVLLQIPGLCATIVPCLHRSTPFVSDPYEDDVVGVVLHATLLNVEVLELIHLMPSTVPVHLYIGEPLTTATPFENYSPDKLALPKRLSPGDPLFCAPTQRAVVFGAYLHSASPVPEEDGAIYGLTVGHAVVPHTGFAPHPRLRSRDSVLAKHRDPAQRRVRSSQLAIQPLGRPLSSPAPRVVAQALRAFELEKARVFAELERVGYAEGPLTVQRRRLQMQDAEYARLRKTLARPQDFDVAHTCAAESLIRPCGSDHGRRGHHRSHKRSSHDSADEHTHLLSWTLMRMTSKASTNPATLHAYPGTLERGAPVSMHIRDPNAERPLAPYRDGVVNGAPASVLLNGHVAREWAVFPVPGPKAIRFAARGDAGALVTTPLEGSECADGAAVVPLALLYAAPERGPYGLVTPLTTILRRIRDVTGMQMRFQGESWRDDCV